ncbi:MAG: DUF4403 family protein [Puia sp.]|nr:DUF4403 family protein [Puia sp.]
MTRLIVGVSACLSLLFLIESCSPSHKLGKNGRAASSAASLAGPGSSSTSAPSSPAASSQRPSPSSTVPVLPDTLPALPVSEIDIPLKVVGHALLARIDSTIPRQFTSDGWPNYLQPSCDFRYKYRFVRSGLQITCVNNKFGVQLTGSYQIAGSRCLCALGKPVSPWISGNCGFGQEPMRRVNISMSSQLYALPGYRIRTLTRLEQLQALDKCTVSLFSSDVTQQILDSIRSSAMLFCSAMDQNMNGMDFQPFVRQMTAVSYSKTPLSQYGYLTINPTAIRLGRLNYTRDTFALSIGLSCRPLLTSDSTNGKISTQLPPLQTVDNRDGLSLYLNAFYDYRFITKLMDDSLRDKVFTIKGRTIVIRDVVIRGIPAHRIEVMIEFAGSNSGRIFLRGTPVLDADKQSLTIPDISYSLESGDLMLKIARSLFKNKIRKSLEGNSYLDLAALIKTNQPMLDAQLNRPLSAGAWTSGKIKDIKLIGLLSQEQGLQIQLHVTGNLSVTSLGTLNR